MCILFSDISHFPLVGGERPGLLGHDGDLRAVPGHCPQLPGQHRTLWLSGGHHDSECFSLVRIAPDMTSAVEWALKTNYLSITWQAWEWSIPSLIFSGWEDRICVMQQSFWCPRVLGVGEPLLGI